MKYCQYIFQMLLVVMLTGCPENEIKDAEAVEPEIARVVVVALKPQQWNETIETYGVIHAADEVSMAVDFSAKVNKVHFKEGQHITPQQVLIEFDFSKRKSRLDQAIAAVNAAKAKLDKIRIDVKRKRRLFRNGNLSRASLDSSEGTLRQLVAHYQDVIAAHRLAMQELREMHMVSPVKGLITKRLIDPGETAVPGKPLIVISTVDNVRVVTYVSERDINHLRLGTEAIVTSAGVRARKYIAHIETLGVKADARTGNFPVKLTLFNDSGLLRPGMTARTKLRGLEIENAIVIPDKAIVDRKRRKVVYLAVNGKAIEVEPVLGVSPGNQVRVIAGLKEGDKLIVDGAENLVHNSPIVEAKP